METKTMVQTESLLTTHSGKRVESKRLTAYLYSLLTAMDLQASWYLAYRSGYYDERITARGKYFVWTRVNKNSASCVKQLAVISAVFWPEWAHLSERWRTHCCLMEELFEEWQRQRQVYGSIQHWGERVMARIRYRANKIPEESVWMVSITLTRLRWPTIGTDLVVNLTIFSLSCVSWPVSWVCKNWSKDFPRCLIRALVVSTHNAL